MNDIAMTFPVSKPEAFASTDSTTPFSFRKGGQAKWRWQETAPPTAWKSNSPGSVCRT